MKALILCAGPGTRLRPLTEKIPKTLLPINGKPLLFYHIESLYKYGVRDIIIRTNHLYEQIDTFVAQNKNKFSGLNIETVFEKDLVGSAGALRDDSLFFQNEKDFLVVYGDNFTNINYGKLLKKHREKGGIATIAAYLEEYPESKGIIGFDENDQILKFIEKPRPEQVISKYANAGMYVFNNKIFEYLKLFDKSKLDFGHDIFPDLLEKKEKMYIYKMNEILIDIGTFESYSKAQKIAINL